MCDDHEHGDHGHDHGHPVGAVGGTKIVVVGKGGAGKTTLTAVLARLLARAGAPVIAVDADEQRNLAVTLGVPLSEAAEIVPVAAAADYVEEKTGARPGEGTGVMLRLNPDTADVVDRLAVAAPDGIRLLVMGGVARAGGGCLCPENTVLSSVLAGMRLRDDDVVIMDTHAGVEHFGRALARGFDSAVVVVEPTYNSVVVGLETARLAGELGIERQLLVVNRATGPDDVARVRDLVAEAGGHFESIHALPDDVAVRATEPSVDGALMGEFADGVAHLAEHLVGRR
jgi:CO dehydrogenase maturation factor